MYLTTRTRLFKKYKKKNILSSTIKTDTKVNDKTNSVNYFKVTFEVCFRKIVTIV